MDPSEFLLAPKSPTLLSSTPALKTSLLGTGKATIPRVDLEPIYTQLKAALGASQWAEYKAAITAFVLGQLNQAELSWVLQPLLSPAPSVITTTTTSDPARPLVSTLHLHNSLLAALYANTLRDAPPSDVAPWVVATDKPTTAIKNAGATGANDQAEERLKRETMTMHARDRRRIKTLKGSDEGATMDGYREMRDYQREMAVKAPEAPSQSAGSGGLQRSNYDVEIRRRYAQPLAAETLEFPTQDDIQNRIEPICAEEGLAAATQSAVSACAELVEQAAEVYLKEMLSQLCVYSRSNGEEYIQTSKYKKQLRKEEDEAERGIIQRGPTGYLPVEMQVQARREPLDIYDLRLAMNLSDSYLRQDRFLQEGVLLNDYPVLEVERTGLVNGTTTAAKTGMNGVATKGERGGADGDAMVVDGEDYWKGGTGLDCEMLMSTLDDCLAVG